MREILFKAKRLDGEWVEGYPVYDRADCTLKRQGKCQCAHDGSLIAFFGWIDNLHEYDEINVDPSTICEYTGMTDKNGTKIFEGISSIGRTGTANKKKPLYAMIKSGIDFVFG